MDVLSIDVGRKNLALCVLTPGADARGRDDVVRRWSVLSMATATCPAVVTCLRDVAAEWLTADVGDVIIERQPGRNPSMKRLEALLEMYFTMHDKKVTLIDPKHKLAFAARTDWWPSGDVPNWTYHTRKKLSVQTTANFLKDTTQSDATNQTFGTSKKKDDLADCLLQGMAFAHGLRRPPPPPAIATAKIVARKPTDKQLKSGKLSKSNVKWMLRETREPATTIASDAALSKAAVDLFGSVGACVEACCK